MSVASEKTFSRDAKDYDSMRRCLVPPFDEFYGAALDAIKDRQPSPGFRVLDLGAGTGLFSSLLLDRFKDAQLHLMDASEAMLEQAKQRFSGKQGVSFEVADMESANLGGPWDAVISALAIHHLADDAKKDLFHRIQAALRPTGLFINAEQVAAPTKQGEERNIRVWNRQIRALGAPEEEIAKAAERMAFDRCASVDDQMAWMKKAGFADVDCIFKSWRFAVLVGSA